MIEVKYENGKNFIRTVGLSTLPTSWFEYEIEKESFQNAYTH